MAHVTDDIRRIFSTSTDFNDIFDAFEAAIVQEIQDIELYRLLFWNRSLTPDEVRLFGEKVSLQFPSVAYDVFLQLANIFEATVASSDNHELAFHYFQKAAKVRPDEAAPYLDAFECYEPDLNIPPLNSLIEFVKEGISRVAQPASLYIRIAHLYELAGDFEQAEVWRSKADDAFGTGPAA